MSSETMDTKEKILQKTWMLMEKKRGKNVRLVDIARAAGVSRQAIYMHFGSRAGLLIATARYLDTSVNLPERSKPVRNASNGTVALEELVYFWANYIPDIYGLAKALLLVRGEDKDAASAWDDRMTAFYGKCAGVIGRIQEEGKLAKGWSVDEASEFTWSMLAVSNWELLTIEQGWSKEQYIQRIQEMLKKTLIEMD